MSYDYAHAKKIADDVIAVLKPFCPHFCEVAGSVRRMKQNGIKDVEIVACPDSKQLYEFSDIVNKRFGEPSIGRYPSKYLKIRSALDLDFFFATPETLGLVFFIRTGSAEFAQCALAQWKKITSGGYSHEARLHLADGTKISTPTEEDVFHALKWDYIPPEKRER